MQVCLDSSIQIMGSHMSQFCSCRKQGKFSNSDISRLWHEEEGVETCMLEKLFIDFKPHLPRLMSLE